MPVTVGNSDSDGSVTDFEDLEGILVLEEEKSVWESQLEVLLEFSESILPATLSGGMKWCHISIRDTLKHVAKTEEILGNMDGATRKILEEQLKAWKERTQTSRSTSRLPYSANVFLHAGDIFYFAFYQNREIPRQVREQMETAFEAQFGSSRLSRVRFLLKAVLRRYSQIEDFLSLLPEIYRSEVLAGVISNYLNPIWRGGEEEVVVGKIKDLLCSPAYHENQICINLLAQDNCDFKQVILDYIFKYVITDATVKETPGGVPVPTSSRNLQQAQNNLDEYEETKSRLKIVIDTDPEMLVKACLATDNLPISLFDIITGALDTISVAIMETRSKLFEDLRPPLFGKGDSPLSLPIEFFRFYERMKLARESEHSLVSRVKTALAKTVTKRRVNIEFWKELFILLSNSDNCRSKESRFDAIYRDLFRQ